MKITHLNPDGLYKNPAFSQGVSVEGPARMVYVGGQNGVTVDGSLVGDDVGSQAERALTNVLEVLNAAGATQEQVVKLTIAIVQGQDVRAAFGAARRVWGPHPTAITVLVVAGLANPHALIEVDAVAAVGA